MVRTLFVDDNPDVAESFATLFRVVGHDARTLIDGRAAAHVVAEYLPHVVFLDLKMPLCDGAVIARDLLALPDRPRVVIVSGSTEREMELRAAGVDGFVVKPAPAAALLAFVPADPAPPDAAARR